MPGADILGAATQTANVGIGTAQLFNSYRDLKRAAAERNRLTPVFYRIQDEYYKNQNLGEQIAGQGLTSAAKDYLTTENARGLGTSIGAINQAGGSPNDISKLFDSYQRNVNATAATDAEAQLKNIQYYMNVNKDLAAQKNIAWGVNEYQPYQAKLKEITQRIAAAKQNIFNSANTVLGTSSAMSTGMSNSDLINNLFNNTGNGNDSGSGSPDPFSTPNINRGQLPTQAGHTATTPVAGKYSLNEEQLRLLEDIINHQ